MVLVDTSIWVTHLSRGKPRLRELLEDGRVAGHGEVLELIEGRALMGTGIGYIDAHLLASALLSDMPLWTSDRRLAKVSRDLGVAYPA